MSILVDRFKKIKSNVSEFERTKSIQIVAVSKTFPISHVKPLLDFGHVHFGENKVQEALTKWNDIKKNNSQIKLHMVGTLQSNKAKKAVEVFDFIHSLDNKKLAENLSKAEKTLKKKLKYFIQVNLGDEKQKSGISLKELENFYKFCKDEKELDVIGLMCIPPNDGNEDSYFKIMNRENKLLSLEELSMGMTADYLQAVKNNATFLRIGSAIFGERIKK